MSTEIINKIKNKMAESLLPEQMEKLELVLIETLSDGTPPNLHKNRKNLIKEFINAKKIEGCSKRTGEYYTSVLTFYEKNIGCDLCLAESETM